MIIKKGNQEYHVTELAQVWKVERTLGGVTVEYKVPKEAAPDSTALEKYIQDSVIF